VDQSDCPSSTTAMKLAGLENIVQEMQKPKPSFWQKMFGGQQT
jgi:hypothetical protein